MVSQLQADLFCRVGDSWSMFEFIQAISTRIPCLSHQKFLRGFLPLVPFCLRAWAAGPRLPRQNTAACGSLAGPRSGRRAAPRGQGGRGCGGQPRPWPRTRICLGKPPETMGSLREEAGGMLMVQVLLILHFFVVSVLPKTCGTNILCCSL